MIKKIINHRLDVWKEEPRYWELLLEMDQRLDTSTVGKNLNDLIKIRVSQINKCAFCIDYHTRDALQHGETARRIFALAAWRESPLFTETERCVLEAAEEMTMISDHGLSDSAYETLRSLFTTREIADIMVGICHMNFLNRVGISTKTTAI